MLKLPFKPISKQSVFIVINQCVCYDFHTSNQDKVRSNNFIVLCVSSTSEFQGVFAKEFQFDETEYRKGGIYVKNYVVYYVVIDDGGQDKIMEVRRFLYNRQNFSLVI